MTTPPTSDLVVLGGITDELLWRFTGELRHPRYRRRRRLRLFINSPGGSMPHALALSRLLLNLFEEIETYNLAMVDSAAVCLYLVGSKRFTFSSSRFFLHPPALASNGPASEAQMLETLSLIRSDTESMIHFYRERTGNDPAVIRRWFQEPCVLSGEEALRQHVATDLCRELPRFSPRYLTDREAISEPLQAPRHSSSELPEGQAPPSEAGCCSC